MQMEENGAAAAAAASGRIERDVLVDYTQEDDDDETLINEPDELFDAEVDEKDEKWASKQRRGRQSDAVLSCPACFTTLCLDCQRHDKYQTQYRAMFVRNCRIVHDEVYQQGKQQQQQKQSSMKRKRKVSSGAIAAPAAAAATAAEVLRPVRCEVCDVEVGVWEAAAEIYHFYNALPSYS